MQLFEERHNKYQQLSKFNISQKNLSEKNNFDYSKEKVIEKQKEDELNLIERQFKKYQGFVS